MSNWLLLALVAYISFSLGIIAGCMIMTKGDRPVENNDLEKEKTEPISKEITASTNQPDEIAGK